MTTASRSQLGPRLRALPYARGLSLAEIAKGTRISTSFLSLVEQREHDVTLGRLMRSFAFFGISVTALVPKTSSPHPEVVRAGEHRPLASPPRRRAATPRAAIHRAA